MRGHMRVVVVVEVEELLRGGDRGLGMSQRVSGQQGEGDVLTAVPGVRPRSSASPSTPNHQHGATAARRLHAGFHGTASGPAPRVRVRFQRAQGVVRPSGTVNKNMLL